MLGWKSNCVADAGSTAWVSIQEKPVFGALVANNVSQLDSVGTCL